MDRNMKRTWPCDKIYKLYMASKYAVRHLNSKITLWGSNIIIMQYGFLIIQCSAVKAVEVFKISI